MVKDNEFKRQQHVKDIFAEVDTDDPVTVRERMHILSLNLFQLRDELQNDAVTAVAVLNAFVWKAIMVQREINCVIDFLDEAFHLAEELDAKWNKVSGKPPLFGLPFSVKGNFYVKGYDCTIGLAKFLQKPMKNDCTLVAYLRSQGAVPFVITTVPQGLLSFVCCSSLYGTTFNPHSHSRYIENLNPYFRTPGGSSGGECALLVAGGSTFGIGSDLAGSLRIPASMCGVVSLKPTEGRLIVKYVHSGVPGKNNLALSYGFFTKTVEEQIFLLRNLLGSSEYPEMVLHQPLLPLNDERLTVAVSRPLRIGYFVEDGFMKPVPACARAVIQTVEKLKTLGHELVQFHLPEPENAASLFYKNLMPHGGDFLVQLYSNEETPSYLRTFTFLLKVPFFVRRIVSFVLSFISKPLSILAGSYIDSLKSLQITQEMTKQYTERFIEDWKELELDALICPAFTVPAVPHDYPSRLGACCFATGLFNMLDFPAGVVPVGKVSATDDRSLLDEVVWPTGNDPALKILRSAARDSVGLPVSVQIVTLPMREEYCLSLMKEVEKVWNK
ncbi:unnamed protein product [Thelazia callipaeda]|uniref:Amidase domain-containing protein n=1 Tax=Thelazia callipaeda TaxID=103827 RepID=A0A0N5CV51_THECL|nr:unnamed protein product [Thelazia callipaeda]